MLLSNSSIFEPICWCGGDSLDLLMFGDSFLKLNLSLVWLMSSTKIESWCFMGRASIELLILSADLSWIFDFTFLVSRFSVLWSVMSNLSAG